MTEQEAQMKALVVTAVAALQRVCINQYYQCAVCKQDYQRPHKPDCLVGQTFEGAKRLGLDIRT